MTNNNNLVENLVEVTLPSEENFLKVMETLTRIGIANSNNELFQSCHILQKMGKYYIVHFKELFILDGKNADFSDEDKSRRNTIANLLDDWKLVSVKDKNKTKEPVAPMSKIKVIPYKDKNSWILKQKYTIGNKRKKNDEVAV